jgi:HK97 gp10 family phage protein
MSVTIKVEGFRQLEKALEELESSATRKNVLRRSLKEAGEPVAAEANSRAPRGPTKQLSKSYRVGTRLSKRQSKLERRLWKEQANKPFVAAYIGTDLSRGGYQEFGTDEHKAQPHFRPAWESGKLGVLEDIKKSMKKNIKKSAERARRKALKAKRVK